MKIQELARKKPYIFWSTKNYDKLSEEVIIEGILEYGDFNDVKKLIEIIGEERTSKIFASQIKKKRSNYDPKTINFFKLYFKHHASRNTHR